MNIKWEKTSETSWFLDINDEAHTFGMIAIRSKDHKYIWRVFSDFCMQTQGMVKPIDFGVSSTLEDAKLNVEGKIGRVVGN